MQASQKLLDAAEVLARQPQSLQLRYLQTLTNIAGGKTSTIVFPMPMELMSSFSNLLKTVHKSDES